VHFFKNFKSPFGECSRAVHIADVTFDFFFFGLAGGVEVVRLVNVRLVDFFTSTILKFLMAELELSVTPSMSVVTGVLDIPAETCSEFRDADDNVPIPDSGCISESESDT